MPGPCWGVAEVTGERENPCINANCELDSHANTPVVGPNFVVMSYTDLVCNISHFSKSYEHRENIPIVKAAMAYDDEKTG